jgi:hypothetical protein
MIPAFLHPQRATLMFGDAVTLPGQSDDRDHLEAAAAAMQQAVRSLQNAARNAERNRDL